MEMPNTIGCEETQFGCCHDGKTAKTNSQGT